MFPILIATSLEPAASSSRRTVFRYGEYEAALRMTIFNERDPVTIYDAESEKAMFDVVVTDRSSSFGAARWR